MSAQYVQPLKTSDDYIHDERQKTVYLGGVGTETPGDAAKLITQGKKVVKLFYENAQWNVALGDGSAPTVIDTDYIPLFRVRYVKCYTGQGLFRLLYDSPESQLVDDYFSLGVMHKMWITKVYLTDANITQGQISLIG